MLRSIGTVVLATTMVGTVAIVGLSSPAYADYVVCPPSGGACYVVVTSPGSPGGPGGGGGGGNGGGGGANATCRYRDELPVPCYDPERGWYNSLDGCYYKADDQVNALLGRPGNYEVRCGPGPAGGCNCYMLIGSLFFPTPPPGFGGPPSPAVLAARAINQLPIRGPAIGIAPDQNGSGLVGLPVWMWTAVAPETWGPISATASVPGLSVTATARAQKIVWDMGDATPTSPAHTITCTSPGTPYKPEYGRAPSPTCGFDTGYARPSNPRYTVTATTYWHVTWAGGGESGAVDVTRTSSTTIEIDELQVVTR